MADENQILISFVTKLASQYKVPATPMVRVLLPTQEARQFSGTVSDALARQKYLHQHVDAAYVQAVPATAKRLGLSQVINTLLALGECTICAHAVDMSRTAVAKHMSIRAQQHPVCEA